MHFSLGIHDANQPLRSAAKAAEDSNVQSGADNRKIDQSSKDFESLLLTAWFQKAYESFGALPGNEDADELGAGSQQFQGIAMQGLATAIVNAGGIGIAKMVADHLRKSGADHGAIPGSTRTIPAVPAEISEETIENSSADGR